MKPIIPTAPIPSRLIFMDSHSSSLSGFTDSFSVLPAWVSQDFTPILIAKPRFHHSIINVAVCLLFWVGYVGLAFFC